CGRDDCVQNIGVIGSLNVDLSIRLPRFHAPGETITGETFDTYAGGKGGNQAVAAAKLGVPVMMVGRLGEDQNGAFYQGVLTREQVDFSCVETVPCVPSGVALIEVDACGENRIAIVPGANAWVDRAQIDRVLPKLKDCGIFLFQLEIPMDTVCYAARLLHAAGRQVMLDPAPAVPLPAQLYQVVDYITPNATELALLTGCPTGTMCEAEAAARILLARGTRAVVAKLGAQGCLYVDAEHTIISPGYRVDVADTTAAGDSFNAGLAVALTQSDLSLTDALHFANAVGALSTTKSGAQSAMPTMAQVKQFMKG
ncbi:MAG: ribokinase, partial [Clostridia bacterium]